MAASSSTAAHSKSNYWYEVFINHRGPDVKKTFAMDLYSCLLSHGLRVFMDQPELQVGENITSQIEEAIRTASVHVAILSPQYTESNWCLDELVLMLKSGATIIPVFHNVKPSEVKWNRGDSGLYAQSLRHLETKKTHDEKLRYDPAIIENWRNALSDVAAKTGLELQECIGGDRELLDKVVKVVLKKVKKTPLNVAKYPTGLDEKVKDFENKVLLQKQSAKPQIVGIVGLGGVGMTTLAKELFNRKCSQYSRCCFLPDVRENAGKGSLNSLQSRLLESLTGRELQVSMIDEGTGRLKEHLKSSEILLVLDDVDHVDQVDALLPHQTILHSNSLILITSRDKDVLTRSRVENSSIYILSGLNNQQSRELFCSHAFGQPFSLPGFESLVHKFLEACGGLPLSLKVFGALLCGKIDTSHWEDQLGKLQRRLSTEIKERLKISYESLDWEEQHIFLDIACFFIGRNSDTVIRIMDGSGWRGRLGIENLQNKCLIELDTESNIHMHDHLRDLGRDIAQTKSPHRFWHPKENIENLLEQLSNGQAITVSARGFWGFWRKYFFKNRQVKVRGIRMVRDILGNNLNDNDYDDDDAFGGIDIRSLRLLHIKDAKDNKSRSSFLGERTLKRVKPSDLIWLHWSYYPYLSLHSWIPMKNLRVLQMASSTINTLWERESEAPLQLRELEINALLSIPKSIIKLKHLERIVLHNLESCSNFQKLPEEFCELQSLKALVLKRCITMESLPESFGNLTNLQHLDLSGSEYLKRLPNSFGNLISLKYLDLHLCWNLTISSEALGTIRTLEYIDFSSSKRIEVLQQVAHQKSLVKLNITYSELYELPNAIGELSDLEVLELTVNAPALPASLGNLRNLKELKLLNCRILQHLPASVGRLPRLTALEIRHCTSIADLPPLPHTLIKLKLIGCHNLSKMDSCSLETLVSLEVFYIHYCNTLKSISGLELLTKLIRLDVTRCRKLEELEGVEHLTSLERLHTYDCPKLQWGEEVVELLRLRLKEHKIRK